MPRVIRSSKHFYQNNNKIKTEKIIQFLDEYQYAVQKYIDYLWCNPIPWQTKKNENCLLDIQNNHFDCPRMFDYKIIVFKTSLSKRALSSAITQALGIIKSKTNDVKKRQYAIRKAKEENKNETIIKKLQKKLENSLSRLKKPILGNNFKAELSSKNTIFEPSQTKHFDYWLKFQALGSEKPFVIPVKLNKQDHKLFKKHYQTKGSFLIGRNSFDIRYEKEVSQKKKGKIVGCDTGIKTVAQFSHENNNVDKVNGLTYEDTVKRCARKRKGSKNFKKACQTRKNVLNAILNKVNFKNVKQINLEDNSTLKYKKRTSRYLKHHAYGEIKNKIESLAEELGVQVKLKKSNYKSQRCSSCGWTQKANRKGKQFICQNCGFAADADYNAALNNELNLCWLDFGLINKQRLNIQGFEWIIDGKEHGVPSSNSILLNK